MRRQGGLIGATALQLGALKYRFEAVKLPDLRRERERPAVWIRDRAGTS